MQNFTPAYTKGRTYNVRADIRRTHDFVSTKIAWINRLQKQSVFLRIQVRASSQTKGLERGWKQRARLGRDAFSLASQALRACEARAPRARKTLTPRVTDFFTDFEKKTDCFAV